MMFFYFLYFIILYYMLYNLLLINNNISQIDILINSLNSNTEYIIYNHSDSIDLILSKINPTKNYNNFGIINHYIQNYPYFDFYPYPLINNISSLDPNLESWNNIKRLFLHLKNNHNTIYFDLLACSLYSNPNWKYIIDKLEFDLNINIRASTDLTGSLSNANWYLETDDINIKDIYFNDNIINFTETLYYYFNGNRIFNEEILNNLKLNTAINCRLIITNQDIQYNITNIYTNNNNYLIFHQNNNINILTEINSNLNLKNYIINGNTSPNNTIIYKCFCNSIGYLILHSDINGNNKYLLSLSNIFNGSPINNWNSNYTNYTNIKVFVSLLAFAILNLDNNTVYLLGNNNFGGSNNSGETLDNIKHVYPVTYGFYAIKFDGSIVRWGDFYNENITFNSIKHLIINPIEIKSTLYSESYICINNDGSVITWGNSSYSYWGNSSSVSSSLSSNVIKVYLNFYSACALKSDGSVVVWGDYFYGGSLNYFGPSTILVSSLLTSGVIKVLPLVFGFVALKNNGSIIYWGSNFNNSSSITNYVINDFSTNFIDVVANDHSFVGIRNDGSIRVCGSHNYGGDNTKVSDLSNVVFICVGIYNYSALLNNNTVRLWGTTNGSTVINASSNNGFNNNAPNSNIFSVFSNLSENLILLYNSDNITPPNLDNDNYLIYNKFFFKNLNFNVSSTFYPSSISSSFIPSLLADFPDSNYINQFTHQLSFSDGKTNVDITKNNTYPNIAIPCKEGQIIIINNLNFVCYYPFVYLFNKSIFSRVLSYSISNASYNIIYSGALFLLDPTKDKILINNNLNINGKLNILNTSNSSSINSGSLVISGGLGVAGNIYYGGSLNAPSDIRIKTNIIDLDKINSYNIIKNIDIVKYDYIDNISRPEKNVIGFIAQNIKDYIPYATNTSSAIIPNIFTSLPISIINYNSFSFFLPSNISDISLNSLSSIEYYDASNIKFSGNVYNYDISTRNIFITSNMPLSTQNIINNQLFIIGTSINDFIYIDKNKIFAVFASATQQLVKDKEILENKLHNLEEIIQNQNSLLLSQQSQIQNLQNQINSILLRLN